jgi:hypothetical protein
MWITIRQCVRIKDSIVFPSEGRESKVKYPPLGAEREALPPLSRVCPGVLIPFI